MGRPVEPLALGDLARRLEELADALPAVASEIDLTAAIGHVARLSHITDSATAFVIGAVRSERPVRLPEREVVEQLTSVMVRIASVHMCLTGALAHVAHGYRTSVIPGVKHCHLRGDEAASRSIDSDFYARAREQLSIAAAGLRPGPRSPAKASPAPPAVPGQPAASGAPSPLTPNPASA